MIELQDMSYRSGAPNAEGDYNEEYRGQLESGDYVEIKRNGYANRKRWSWMAYHAPDYPIQCFLWSDNALSMLSPEEALDDFRVRYDEWCDSYVEPEPEYYRCLGCGWVGEGAEIGSKTVYEDYGDVSCWVCPGCGRVEYDGLELLVPCRN